MTDVEFDAQVLQVRIFEQAQFLRDVLEARIRQKLAGDVLNSHSGSLAASIVSSIESDGADLSVSISSTGLAYAAIQEFGGKTAAHDIIATSAKALAFNVGGNQSFAKSVHHPGSVIPARSYLQSSLTEMRAEIESGFKQSVLEALAQG
ncbi:hypothetical protein QEV83_05075 [Methylocapsa sp. D3K7]|uniref:hypothetical protein n=1 Tax=Methylocapsa sp. D3K7 TaxID=3041435 RepID=UPI00244EC2AB|nr:hypothetical protein [Methylocapsa sp. D3K7]WGJ15639.1 hypothetical protein QEV83_05075 [Methylocapsa sp. D3K7]